ncbi:hypothetical protein GCM10017620_25650 [Brevundimonas intermedia]|uniref:Uncharacterized protein n=1 Tax=Brevundimonas intermedia TaxID=74315 RepID=A0ABQ5TB13_9CAUL|nr:hypothetical protein [Brevundimonas intermedia]GLK49592.1 hypothetical protein GCM10017620_25650 [Brevundimonas intermedia]
MQGYETPVLNQIAFAFGMSAVIFWPAWLAAFVVGAVRFLRYQLRSGALLVVAAAIPAMTVLVFFVLVQNDVEVGPMEGLFAQTLSAAFWPYLISTSLCVLGLIAVVMRSGMNWLKSRWEGLYA